MPIGLPINDRLFPVEHTEIADWKSSFSKLECNIYVYSDLFMHCSTYLTWLDVCIYVPRSHFHFLKRMLGKGQLRTA